MKKNSLQVISIAFAVVLFAGCAATMQAQTKSCPLSLSVTETMKDGLPVSNPDA